VTNSVGDIIARFPNVNDIPNHNESQVNDNVPYKDKKQRAANVASTALIVADTLGEPQNIKFFMKAAWALPEARIMSNLEQSLNKRKPGAYFVTLCKMEMPE